MVLTGAGISAESGLATFRDAGGLWEGHKVEDVATPEAWQKNPERVLTFYNQRRKAARQAKPNRAHEVLSELQQHFDVTILTQNVDDLHERAGSKKIIHLHGSLFESRSTIDPLLIYKIKGEELNMGNCCERGSQLRPHIVWFGEMVPMMEVAARRASLADIFLVVGTSLMVYPAAGLIDYVPDKAVKYIVDPKKPEILHIPNLRFVTEKASLGLEIVKRHLLNENG